ncbi:MAG TPA: cation transporting ATPase C-terminal domain-containing protein, partial [Nitrospiria bacterium]|nr:cation transporting ATPase C-terminal domain-containing protein [Nitrospiria bacterium]
PSNPYLWLSLGGTLLLQGVALFVPGLRRLLGLTPISLLDGAVIGASAVLPLLINEATKGSVPRASDAPEEKTLGSIATSPSLPLPG